MDRQFLEALIAIGRFHLGTLANVTSPRREVSQLSAENRPGRSSILKWHVRVRLDYKTFEGLCGYFLNRAVNWSDESPGRDFLGLPF
jgi:hypothetical protein